MDDSFKQYYKADADGWIYCSKCGEKIKQDSNGNEVEHSVENPCFPEKANVK